MPLETDEFKSAVDLVHQLWTAGVISPDSPSQSINQAGQAFYAGKTALCLSRRVGLKRAR